ncbi:MAG: hypothetical protein M4579_002420 [Chaenotheca gracillima]|nr:MAG: hypothetical protein M4579_002420 [Chaenotheca gracillima]
MDFRCGGPVLCVLPAKNWDLSASSSLKMAFDDSLRAQIAAVLGRHKIRPIKIEIWRRATCPRSIGWQEDLKDTVLVSAEKKPKNLWSPACIELLELFTEFGFPELNIEIADKRGVELMPVHALPKDASILKVWHTVFPSIQQALEGSKWRTIDVVLQGWERKSHENPETIVITLMENSPGNWQTIIDEIEIILERARLPNVACRFIWPEDLNYTPQTKLAPNLMHSLTTEARLGASLGPRKSTLGGFIELQDINSREWRKFGLTCFHCVIRPTQPTALVHTPEQPVFRSIYPGGTPNRIDTPLLLSQPALRDVINDNRETHISLKRIRDGTHFKQCKADLQQYGECLRGEELAHIEDLNAIGALEEKLRKVKEFLKGKTYLGNPKYATQKCDFGCTETLRYFDWALVHIVSERLEGAKNLVTEWSPPMRLSYSPAGNVAAHTDPEYGELEKLVWKQGRTTGLTQGVLNNLPTYGQRAWIRADTGELEPIITQELAVIGAHQQPFSGHGDSGSIVFDRLGHMVGLLYSSNPILLRTNFMSVDDLFEDLKRVPGISDVRLPNED